MPGFFDKLTNAAKELKEQLDDSGLLDKLTGSGDAASESSDAAAAPTTGGASSWTDDQWQRALDRGAADLEALLTIDEVAEATGLPIDQAGRHVDEEWFGVSFGSGQSGQSHYFELRAFHGHVDEDSFDPAGIWDFVREAVPDPTPLDGIGTEAFSTEDGTVYARVADQVLFVVSNAGGRDDYPLAEVNERLLRLAASRMN